MKKHTNIFIFALLISAVFAIFVAAVTVPFDGGITAYASDIPQISVTNLSVHRGKTFSVDVELTENSGLIALFLELDFDTTAFKLISVENGQGLEELTYGASAPTASIQRFSWYGAESVTITGKLLTLVFESNPSAAVGEYTIDFSYMEENTLSDYRVPTEVAVTGGKVQLTTGEFMVKYLNADSTQTVLAEYDYNSEDTPEYKGATPTLAADSKYSYSFKGWQGVVTPEPNLIIYRATYTNTPQEYQLFAYVDGEYYSSMRLKYGQTFTTDSPKKVNNSFKGWFTDEQFTTKLSFNEMPDHDVRLYGYFRYNLREADVPEIGLRYLRTTGDIVEVEVSVNFNPGLAYMLLFAKFDTTYLSFYDCSKYNSLSDFDFSYGRNGQDLYFNWNRIASQKNSFQTGAVLLLKFKLSSTAPDGVYPVTLVQRSTNDAVYYNEGELWYTNLDISAASVPKGSLTSWRQVLSESNAEIKVDTHVPLTTDVQLEVQLVTDSIARTLSNTEAVLTDANEIKSIYSANLMRQGAKVKPDGKTNVSIKLTPEEAASDNIKLFSVDSNGVLAEKACEIKDGYLLFITDELGYFAIVGDKVKTQSPLNLSLIIILSVISFLCLSAVVVLIMQISMLKIKIRKIERNSSANADKK